MRATYYSVRDYLQRTSERRVDGHESGSLMLVGQRSSASASMCVFWGYSIGKPRRPHDARIGIFLALGKSFALVL